MPLLHCLISKRIKTDTDKFSFLASVLVSFSRNIAYFSNLTKTPLFVSFYSPPRIVYQPHPLNPLLRIKGKVKNTHNTPHHLRKGLPVAVPSARLHKTSNRYFICTIWTFVANQPQRGLPCRRLLRQEVQHSRQGFNFYIFNFYNDNK